MNHTVNCNVDCVEYSDEALEALEKVNISVSTLSLLGSIFVIVVFSRLKVLRTFAFRLVFWTALADGFHSFGNFLGDAGGNEGTWFGASTGLCFFQSIVISYFKLASLIWSVSIAFTLHMGFLKQRQDFNPNEIHKHERKYHLVAWGYPFVMTFLPFTTNSYGDVGGWCWIQSYNNNYIWRFIQFYIFLILAVCYNAYVFYNVWKKLSIQLKVRENKVTSRMVSRMKFYPLVLIVCNTAGVFTSIIEVGHGAVFHLSMLSLITGSLQGFVNAIVYGLTPDVQAKVLSCGSSRKEGHI